MVNVVCAVLGLRVHHNGRVWRLVSPSDHVSSSARMFIIFFTASSLASPALGECTERRIMTCGLPRIASDEACDCKLWITSVINPSLSRMDPRPRQHQTS